MELVIQGIRSHIIRARVNQGSMEHIVNLSTIVLLHHAQLGHSVKELLAVWVTHANVWFLTVKQLINATNFTHVRTMDSATWRLNSLTTIVTALLAIQDKTVKYTHVINTRALMEHVLKPTRTLTTRVAATQVISETCAIISAALQADVITAELVNHWITDPTFYVHVQSRL